ncbi:MAG TPA: DUF5667 domain-containing protein [Patescibacteria group bacterium]|nr:DUF5667 domain-containing protein [Patescibacteria group bacterium]
MNKKTVGLVIGIFILFFLLGGFISTVKAQTLRRFYDWSATLETNDESPILGVQVFAQEATTSVDNQQKESTPSSVSSPSTATSPGNYTQFKQFDKYILGGNLLPNSPLYFIKTFQESMQLVFTTNPQAKAKLRIAISGERISEMQQLATLKSTTVASAAENYQKIMDDMTEGLTGFDLKDQEIKDILKEVENETAKHSIILERIAVQIPDEAKDAIEAALEASWKGTDTVADLEGRPAVPADLVAAFDRLKSQGLVTEEEVAKLIAIKTREEARQESMKYVKEGIIPEADFLRFNENMKSLYPDEFFKLHELKRFYEIQKYETQKPDEVTLSRMQEFAKTYKSGEIVPEDIRKYWAPVVRLEELQNTLRPDLIDENLFKSRPNDYKQFTALVDTFKPRPEDIAYLNTFLAKNNAHIKTLPPEYQRMYNLGQKYGAQCGVGYRWEPLPQTGGVCVKAGDDIRTLNLPRIEEFAQGKSCSGTIVSAKGPGEICSAYPSDCVPPGWSKTTTCVETPESVGNRNSVNPLKSQCPSNAHYVPFIEACVPNYTPTENIMSSGGFIESACPAGYHRNYAGGACMPDYTGGATITSITTTFSSYTLPPLTQTPGTYPSPFYSPIKCAPQTHWVPEPINQQGGYCAPDNYTYGGGSSNVSSGQLSCPPPASGCSGGTTWDTGTCTCKPACPAGTSWTGGYCMQDTAGTSYSSGSNSGSSCQSPSSGCGANKYWDYTSCVCRESGSYPSSCAYPSGGCESGKYWDNGSCSCKSSSSGTGSTGTYETSGTSTSSTSGSSSSSGSSSQPPSGYGSCPSGQYWNGSACMTSTSETSSSNTSGGTSSSSSTSTTTSPPPSTETQPPPPSTETYSPPPSTETQPPPP